jgi:hypothetical protein
VSLRRKRARGKSKKITTMKNKSPQLNGKKEKEEKSEGIGGLR